jgi:hypothetical protein
MDRSFHRAVALRHVWFTLLLLGLVGGVSALWAGLPAGPRRLVLAQTPPQPFTIAPQTVVVLSLPSGAVVRVDNHTAAPLVATLDGTVLTVVAPAGIALTAVPTCTRPTDQLNGLRCDFAQSAPNPLRLSDLRAPAAVAATPSPTPDPAVTIPFPLHFLTLPRSVIAGQPLDMGVDAQPAAGTTVSYAWDFGDGSSATGASAHHAYADPGPYTVTVTATAGGMQARVHTSVTAVPRPVPLVLQLAPGDQAQVSFATGGCPPPFYAPTIAPGAFPYMTPSCGCCTPSQTTVVNDADIALGFVYDSAAQTVTLAAPAGWDVAATDFPGCVPLQGDVLAVLSCPAPHVHFPFHPTLHVGAAPTGTYPTSISYPAGWNLISGVRLSGSEGTVYTASADGSLQPLQGLAVDQGTLPEGYVAYFPQPVTVPLAPRGPLGGSIQVGAPQWLLLGNPGQTPVSVEGADAVEAFDPTTNSYIAVAVLQPGQAAWVYPGPTGLVTLVPQPAPGSP